MTDFAPPTVTNVTGYVPSARMLATLVRCDYPRNGPQAQWGYVAARNTLGDWVLIDPRKAKDWSGDDLQDAALHIPGAQVAWTRVTADDKTTKRTPPWAIVLGILGLFVFLLGALLFLVKETTVDKGALVEIAGTDGRVLAFRATGVDANTLRVQMGAM